MYIVETKDRVIVTESNPMKDGKIDPAFADQYFGSMERAQIQIDYVRGPVKNFALEYRHRLEIFEAEKRATTSYFDEDEEHWFTEKGAWVE